MRTKLVAFSIAVATSAVMCQVAVHSWLHHAAYQTSELFLENPPSALDVTSIDSVMSKLLLLRQDEGTGGGSASSLSVSKPLTLDETPPIDYVIIAGAWRVPDRRCGLSRAFKQRLLAGLDVASITGAKAILVSGGKNDTYCGTTYLKHIIFQRFLHHQRDQATSVHHKDAEPVHALGRLGPVYAPDDFLMENDSTTTYTNAAFSLNVLLDDVKRHPDRSIGRSVVVTSPCHLKRTSFFFRQVFRGSSSRTPAVGQQLISFVASHRDEYEWVQPQRRMYWAEHPAEDGMSAGAAELLSQGSSVDDVAADGPPSTAFKGVFPTAQQSAVGVQGGSGSSILPVETAISDSPVKSSRSVMTTMLRPQEDWWLEEMEAEDAALRGGDPSGSSQECEHSRRKRNFIDPTRFPQLLLPKPVSLLLHSFGWTVAKWNGHLRATVVSMEWVSEAREVGAFVLACVRGHLRPSLVLADFVTFVNAIC